MDNTLGSQTGHKAGGFLENPDEVMMESLLKLSLWSVKDEVCCRAAARHLYTVGFEYYFETMICTW